MGARTIDRVRCRVGAVTTVVVVLCLAACGASPGSNAASERVPIDRINGVRTTPNGSGLVVSYTGGACDTSAQVRVGESHQAVDLAVQVTVSGGSCAAVGIERTVTAALRTPLSTRQVRYGDTVVVPFDGARLRTPTSLPAGFVATAETGGRGTSTGDTTDLLTDRWTLTWSGDPTGDDPGAACRPGRGRLALVVGPTSAGQLRAGTLVGQAELDGTAAVEYEERNPTDASTISSRSLQWASDGGSVAVSTASGCSGDSLLSIAELLTVARSLRPLT